MNDITILMYLNGNNELEPEIWHACSLILEMEQNKNICIVIQISRQSNEITNQIRKNYKPAFSQEWIGTRRYIINNGQVTFTQLDNLNMADSSTLYHFIVWAQQNFQSSKYCLILGGHVYQFVGISPDFNQDQPYIMGIPELAVSLQESYNTTKKIIDILILDTCYASTFEVLCEFGRYQAPSVQNILTYIGGGPAEGLPYTNLINLFATSYNSLMSNEQLIIKIINYFDDYNFPFPLIGLKINHNLLEKCKLHFSVIAYEYLSNKPFYKELKTPYELLSINSTYSWYRDLKIIHKISKEMIISSSKTPLYNSGNLPIHVLYTYIPDEDRRNLYSRLYFACKNDWANLLCDYPLNKTVSEIQPKLSALPMTHTLLQSFITNANKSFTLDKQISIKNQLIAKKSWNLIKYTNKIKLQNRISIAYILPLPNQTSDIKMLLQQMEQLKLRGHRIFVIYKTDKPKKELSFDWINMNVDKHVIISPNEPYSVYLLQCDVIISGFLTQLPELTNIGKPIIYWEQGHEGLFDDTPYNYSKEEINTLLEYCYKSPCQIFSVSNFVANTIKNKFGVETKLLLNGINTTLYHPGKEKEKNLILLIGDPFLKFKGFSIAISALNIAWKLGYDFHVIWVCQTQPNVSNILFPIEYIVNATEDKIAELYRKAEIFVFSSWNEGFCMRPLEAMASGTAVVCTRCGGIDDYIINKFNALTVEPGDVKTLAAYIILLLKNSTLRDSLVKNAIKTSIRFDYKNVIDYLENIISSC